MKRILIFFSAFLFISQTSFADQLAYLSKADADRAASYIESVKKLALYCGCCDNQVSEVIKVKGAEVKFTGYEAFYEVFVMYSYQGELKSVPLDLAYAWVKIKGKVQTIASVLGLEHDPCKTPDW